MKVLQFTITPESPLVFSDRRPAGQFGPSVPFIPGAALRGALARQMISDGVGPGFPDFDALFTEQDAPQFRNAYPGHSVLPATAYSCKAEPGFDKHGAHDSLIDRFCWETLNAEQPLAFAYVPRCNYNIEGKPCGGRVEAFSGFYNGTDVNCKKAAAPLLLTTRVALNRKRRVAEDSLLYSPLAIGEGVEDKDREPDEDGKRWRKTVFHGSVAAQNEAAAELVTRWLGQLNHVGSGTSRGFGQIAISGLTDLPDSDLDSRIESFNTLLKDRWNRWTLAAKRETALAVGTYFAVLLMSDAILKENGWTPTVRLEPSLLPDGLSSAILIRCSANADYKSGWNTAWKLPKDTELAASRGSVYLYRVPDGGVNCLESELLQLEADGVGERRHEGYGQVRICDGFHLRLREERT